MKKLLQVTILLGGMILWLPSKSEIQSTEKIALPSPLTLEFVLDLPARLSPSFMQQQAALLQAQAARAQLRANDGVELNLEGRIGQREFSDQQQDYHRAAIHLGVPLFDFGRTAQANQAWLLSEQAQQSRLELVEKQFRLLLMRAFFNVLLADVQYRVDNEAMAIAYVTLDKVREDHTLGRASDLTLLENEAAYQKSFVKRQAALVDLRRSRMLLANAMGYPDAVISQLAVPNLKPWTKDLAQVEDYIQQALNNNPELQAAKQQLNASDYLIKSAQAGTRPVVRADAWVGQLSSYPELREGTWHAELSLVMPLYDSGLTKSKVDNQRAQRQQAFAELMATEQRVREQVANLYFQLAMLKVEQDDVKATQAFADINLDYKRGLYENELQSDLGDAMVRISQAHYDTLAFEFKQALLWAQMQVLVGENNQAPKQESGVTP